MSLIEGIFFKVMNNKGIGIVELLVTIVVLGVLFTGSFLGFIAANRMLHAERLKLEASYLAEAELERLSSLDYDDPELDIGAASVNEHVTFSGNTLPASCLLRSKYNGVRTYDIIGKDINSTLDTDGNGDSADDIDYKAIEVKVVYDFG